MNLKFVCNFDSRIKLAGILKTYLYTYVLYKTSISSTKYFAFAQSYPIPYCWHLHISNQLIISYSLLQLDCMF